MKTEFTDVSETRKHLSFEIPPDIVDAEIDRVAKGYTRSAKVPGFRPGRVPATVVRQRYKDQILYDVAHDLIPRLVGDALRERGLEPVAAPDIKDVVLHEGQPLTFVADFETMPPIDPGDYVGITVRKPPAVLEVGAVDRAIEQLQQQHARWHPVEDRPAEAGDTIVADVTRTRRPRLVSLPGDTAPQEPHPDDDKPEHLENATIEIGASANPPEFDAKLTGVSTGETREFTVDFPATYEVAELASARVDYVVAVKGIRRRELLPLDDDFAKEVSDVETMDALKTRVREELQKGAEHDADHEMRHALLQELARRLRTVPDVLVDQEVDRRLEEFVRRLMEQGVDPMKAEVDWRAFRERQREASAETVRSTLVVDDVARRESIEATDEDVAAEIDRFAERAGRTPAAVRAQLEKDGALDRIRAGIRREKTMAWLIERAHIVN
ncbi:MAG TPA: trigger factor [Vicinamibacterales bacterium]|jgi:trigger factor|nr:trigger factor [Vicinamibacterales bacterium]